MSCESACDCGAADGLHDSDCHMHALCDEGKWCDKHLGEAAIYWAYLKGVHKYAVMPGDSELERELKDAGR